MGDLAASGSWHTTPAHTTPAHTTPADREAGNPREHSETAAEGNDGGDMPEIRMHAQAAAEGPDSD